MCRSVSYVSMHNVVGLLDYISLRLSAYVLNFSKNVFFCNKSISLIIYIYLSFILSFIYHLCCPFSPISLSKTIPMCLTFKKDVFFVINIYHLCHPFGKTL